MSNKAEPKTNVKGKLIGEDGNAFYILGKVCKALRDAGYPLPTLIPNSGRELAHRPFGYSVFKEPSSFLYFQAPGAGKIFLPMH